MSGGKAFFAFAREAAWGNPPAGRWSRAVCRRVDVPRTQPAAHREENAPAKAPSRGALLGLEVLPTAADLADLAAAALGRDGQGRVNTYALHVGLPHAAPRAAGAPKRWPSVRVCGAAVRRFKMRAGLAKPVLEFAYDFVGKGITEDRMPICGRFDGHFGFGGAQCLVDLEEADLKEFSISLNNNVFVGPADEQGAPEFFAAGRQAVTGYICVAGGNGDLLDGGVHSLEVRLPGRGGCAVASAREVAFTWRRRITSVAAGPLEVLYFEGAGGAIEGGLEVCLAR